MKTGSAAHVVTLIVAIIVAVCSWIAAYATVERALNPPSPTKVSPPAPVQLPALDTDWVDLQVYLRNHPVWRPE